MVGPFKNLKYRPFNDVNYIYFVLKISNEILDKFIATRHYLAVLFFKEGEEESMQALQVKEYPVLKVEAIFQNVARTSQTVCFIYLFIGRQGRTEKLKGGWANIEKNQLFL